MFGRFDLAALCGCHTLNVCLWRKIRQGTPGQTQCSQFTQSTGLYEIDHCTALGLCSACHITGPLVYASTTEARILHAVPTTGQQCRPGKNAGGYDICKITIQYTGKDAGGTINNGKHAKL